MTKVKSPPPPESISEYLKYDPRTGEFRCAISHKGRWTPGKRADRLHSSGYRFVTFLRRTYGAHRLAWFFAYGEWPQETVDHRNMDPQDNRLQNLRLANHSQQMANTRGHGASAKGTTRLKDGRYQAQICVAGRRRTLGRFPTEAEAHAAYAAAASAVFGEFARLA